MSAPAGLDGRARPGRVHAELLRLSLDSWPSSLGGVALMASGVTAAFAAFATSRAIWVWGALCLLLYGCHAVVLWRTQRSGSADALPAPFTLLNLLLGAAGGSLWGTLTWIAPVEPPSLPPMAALACGVQMLGTARTPSSMAMLRAITLPASR